MANIVNRSFSAGELAPALYARTDLAKYEVGLRQCRNFIVSRQGGVTKRPGTEFVCAQKDGTKKGRLIPFLFNVSDTLVLAFEEKVIRFIQDGGIVVDLVDPSVPYEVATPYLETDLPDIKYVQSGDVVTLVHRNYPPKELRRFNDASWTLTDIVFNPSLAAPTGVTVTGGSIVVVPTHISNYVVTALTIQGEESLNSTQSFIPHQATTGSPITISWTAVTGAASYKVYKRQPDLITLGSGGGVYAYIGETTTTNLGDNGSILPDITLQPPIPSTLFQALNDYPSVVTYYQQRLVFANSNNHPDTFWASRTGAYHNFTTSTITQDDDAITARLVSEEIDPIEHILNVGRMVVGSQGAEWIVEGDNNGVLTPSAVNSRIGASDGVASLRPIKAGNQLLFLQALGSEVRTLEANVQFGYYSLASSDVTIYSSHLVDGHTITDWTWQQIFPHVLWAVRSDGTLLGLTFIPEQEVLAWHRHDTKGFVESVCAVPEGGSHFVYWMVKRLIQGQYVRYIERQTTLIPRPIGAPGASSVVTPPPPPPAPPPTPTSIAPPTNLSTTDIGSTSATANWIAGNTSANSVIQIRLQGGADWSVIPLLVVPVGQQSYHFTGLFSGDLYEWRVEHLIGSDGSGFVGPVAGSQFRTIAVTPTLTNPTSAPTFSNIVQDSGVTRFTIQWPASPQGGNANVQIGEGVGLPTDGEFEQVGFGGTFASGVTAALWQVIVSGDFWLRVRYELDGFVTSQFVTSNSSTTITVTP